MLKSKVRKEKLSIYLASDPLKSDSEILKTENSKEPINLDIPESGRATLYIKKESTEETASVD